MKHFYILFNSSNNNFPSIKALSIFPVVLVLTRLPTHNPNHHPDVILKREGLRFSLQCDENMLSNPSLLSQIKQNKTKRTRKVSYGWGIWISTVPSGQAYLGAPQAPGHLLPVVPCSPQHGFWFLVLIPSSSELTLWLSSTDPHRTNLKQTILSSSHSNASTKIHSLTLNYLINIAYVWTGN